MSEADVALPSTHLKERRYAPRAFAYRPRSLKELDDTGLSIELDVTYEPHYLWIAEEMATAELQQGWAEHPDENGYKYYYNDETGESSYTHPNATYYKELYQKCVAEDTTAGIQHITIASRLKSHEEAIKQLAGPSKRVLHSHRDEEQKRAQQRKEHIHAELTVDGIIGPKDIIENAKHLGIAIGDDVSHKETEYYLLPFAAEYIENYNSGIFPHPWQAHEDYFYNWETEEMTYDDPRLSEILTKIDKRRKEIAAHPLWPKWKGDRVDMWWAFTLPTSEDVFYFNFMTGEKADLPPDIGLKNAIAAQRGIRKFIAKKKVEKTRMEHVLEMARNMASGDNPSEDVRSDFFSWREKPKSPHGSVKSITSETSVKTLDTLVKETVVGGKVFNIDEHKAAMEQEESKWEMQVKQQDCISELYILCDKAENIDPTKPHDAWWTPQDYEAALHLVIKCANVGLCDADTVLKGHEEGHAMCNKLAALASKYESEEGRRRALAHIKQNQDELKNRVARKKDIRRKWNSIRTNCMKFRELAFTSGVYHSELNGLIIHSPSPDSVLSLLEKCEASVLLVKTKINDLPSKDRLLTEVNMAPLEEVFTILEDQNELLVNSVDEEVKRRHEVEARAEAKANIEKRKAQDKIEREKIKEENRLKEEAEAARIALEKKIREQEEATEADEKKKKQIAEERERLTRELNEALEKKAKDTSVSSAITEFEKDIFANSDGRHLTEKEIELQALHEKEAYEAEVERLIAERRAEKDFASKAAEQQKEAAAAAEAERIRKIEEEYGKDFINKQNEFEAEKQRRLDKMNAKERLLAEREYLRLKMKNLLDEDEDDTEEEKKARAVAKEQLKTYEGGPFRAARDANMQILKAFFLCHGSDAMLNAHDKDTTGGGRTLLHTACWWGNEDMVRFLVKIGADVNSIDTVYNKFTPLFEAVRGGRMRITKYLLQQGANIRVQDFQGNTVMHWAARRGWGALFSSLLRLGELYEPGSTKGLLLIKNDKGKLPSDVCKNFTVRNIVDTEVQLYEGANMRRKGLMSKLRKAGIKAKFMGAHAREAHWKARARQRRYGIKNTKNNE